MILIFHKPFNVLCQFTSSDDRVTLKKYIKFKNLYPAGRLDRDSEGLVLLTDDGKLQNLVSHPRFKLPKTYWAQVEGIPDEGALAQLVQGVALKEGKTKPAIVKQIGEPDVGPRNPPIRYRKNIPTSWLELTISEGKNRQVRRMTAAVGFPTLRLIRYAIGPLTLDGLIPGEFREVQMSELLESPHLSREWRKMALNPMQNKTRRGSNRKKASRKHNTSNK